MERRTYNPIEFQPKSVVEKSKNRGIVDKAAQILKDNGAIRDIQDLGREDSVSTVIKLSPGTSIRIEAVNSGDCIFDLGMGEIPLPESFSGPLVIIEATDFDNTYKFTSPYGELPTRVTDANGKPYLIGNIFVIDFAGQAVKCESVFERVMPEDEKQDELPYYLKTDINISPEDSRFIRISPEDQETIETALDSVRKNRVSTPQS